MTVSLKFSVSSLADSGRNLVSGRSVFSDTDLYSNSNMKIGIPLIVNVPVLCANWTFGNTHC